MTSTDTTALLLPGAPDIPGLRFRPYRDERDIPALLSLLRAVNAADGETEEWTEEELRLELANPTHIDPRKDDIFAFIGDALVADTHIEWVEGNDGSRLYRSVGHVHPDHRRRGLGAVLFDRSERRLMELAAGHALDRPAFLTTWFPDTDVGAAALAGSRGYERIRVYHHMTRPDLEDILVPPLPAGLTVRPPERSELPAVWDAIIESFRDHFGGQDGSPAAYRRWSGDSNLEPSLWSVAYDGDQIAGGVLGYIIPEENEAQGYLRGWADPVFVRRPWRRRGLASALLGRTLQLLRDRGMTSAQLDVDSENTNQALGLYERHGFVTDRSASEYRKALTV